MKSNFLTLRQSLAILLVAGSLCTEYSCQKSSAPSISQPKQQVANPVQPGNIGGTIKGTFLADSVYYVTSDIVVNKGDTVIFQPGVKIYFKGNYNFFLHGNLSSVGTKSDPVWFTVQGQAKFDNPNQDPTSDPAYAGIWGGIHGDTTTVFMIFKYTHIEFTGGKIGTAQTFGTKNGSYAAAINFTNVNGILDVEDSWFYGCIDGGAAIATKYGKFNVMRNTFEKVGIYGSECFEGGNGTIGNVAYNLMIGTCTNGIKMSNGGTLAQDDISVYNNTILNGGFRRYDYGGAGNQGGRGGSISFEQNAKGQVYNNLIVNCRIGLRIVGTGNYSGNALLIADTAHMFYGHNYNYADSLMLADQFYPTSFLTKPEPTDIPNPSVFLPSNFTLGADYDGSAVVGMNNPQFVNYPLPLNLSAGAYYTLDRLAYASGFDFHLKPGSPAIGKGTTAFTITNAGIPIDPNFGATEITPPGIDIGCYQSAGSGLRN
jgi:hypothetical protein